jgi:hypothetical protein
MKSRDRYSPPYLSAEPPLPHSGLYPSRPTREGSRTSSDQIVLHRLY